MPDHGVMAGRSILERPGSSPGRPVALRRLDRISGAVLEAVAYADVFRWPLTAAEVHRFLPVTATPDEVDAAVISLRLSGRMCSRGGLVALAGREHLFEDRRSREAISALLWPSAIRFGRHLSRLPWVRLVAVSGSLAAGAAGDDADIDLFIVTDDGRVWLTRALTIGVARLAARRPWTHHRPLCPNFLVGGSAMELPGRDVFTAHELAQLVPLHGPDTYRSLLALNGWYHRFLPNHPGFEGPIAELGGRRMRRVIEPILGGRLADHVEAWEMRRKVARLSVNGPAGEVRFDHTMCKGHFGGHRRRAMNAFDATMRRLREDAT